MHSNISKQSIPIIDKDCHIEKKIKCNYLVWSYDILNVHRMNKLDTNTSIWAPTEL